MLWEVTNKITGLNKGFFFLKCIFFKRFFFLKYFFFVAPAWWACCGRWQTRTRTSSQRTCFPWWPGPGKGRYRWGRGMCRVSWLGPGTSATGEGTLFIRRLFFGNQWGEKKSISGNWYIAWNRFFFSSFISKNNILKCIPRGFKFYFLRAHEFRYMYYECSQVLCYFR